MREETIFKTIIIIVILALQFFTYKGYKTITNNETITECGIVTYKTTTVDKYGRVIKFLYVKNNKTGYIKEREVTADTYYTNGVGRNVCFENKIKDPFGALWFILGIGSVFITIVLIVLLIKAILDDLD